MRSLCMRSNLDRGEPTPEACTSVHGGSNDQLDQWDRDNFFHPSTHLAQHARGESPNRIVTGGNGVYIEDRDGNRLLDAFAGLYCVNVGYGRPEIADAIADQARELAYYHSYVGHGTEASITLAKMILDRAPSRSHQRYMRWWRRIREAGGDKF